MNTLRKLALCLLLGCGLTITACGDDEDDGGEAGSAGEAGEGGEGGDSGEGGTSGGSGGTSGGGAGGTSGGAGGTSGGSGGTGGSDEDSGVDDDGGTEIEEHTASADIEPLEDNDVTGTATFTTDGADVMVEIVLNDCVNGSYQVHIHEGEDCENFGPHWDPPRGEGIPNVQCTGDTGTRMYTRLGTDDEPWSIGLGEDETDVHGHTIVVHTAEGTPIACGEITED